MNDLQKVEFDIFLEFDFVCRKLNLNYFLVSGTALGAVRHGGIIPWDDDLDVAMFRDDYNKFMELAPRMLPNKLFLQNYKTDKNYPFVFAKLRNKQTAFIETALRNFDMNHGIYIDIFPLDGYPEKKCEQKKLEKKKRIYRRLLCCGFDMPRTLKSSIYAKFLRFFGYHKNTARTLAKYEALISKYTVKDSKNVCNHGNRYGEKDYMPAEYYGDGTDIIFEGVKTKIPQEYDKYLTRLYGDWKNPPPLQERKVIHQHVACDVNNSYVLYTNKGKAKK